MTQTQGPPSRKKASRSRRISLEPNPSHNHNKKQRLLLEEEEDSHHDDDSHDDDEKIIPLGQKSIAVSSSSPLSTLKRRVSMEWTSDMENEEPPSKKLKRTSTISCQTDLSWLLEEPTTIITTRNTSTERIALPRNALRHLVEIPTTTTTTIQYNSAPKQSDTKPQVPVLSLRNDVKCEVHNLVVPTTTVSMSPFQVAVPLENLQTDLVTLLSSLALARQAIASTTSATQRSVSIRTKGLLKSLRLLWMQLTMARREGMEAVSRPPDSTTESNKNNRMRDPTSMISNLAEARNNPEPAVKQRRSGSSSKNSKNTHSLLRDLFLLIGLMFVALLAEQGRSIFSQFGKRLSLPDTDCIYVTGGGFSGFWFSIGRLHSIQDPLEHRYVCYSAGCLGVVARFTNQTSEDLYDMAKSIQNDWKDGSLHRYHVVEEFVTNLLEDNTLTPEMLSSLHILTSVPEGTAGFTGAMHTPTTKEELHSLLVQTTWIPFAIGSAYTDPSSGHMDGAFSAWQHPVCDKHVGLANDWDLMSNTLNVNLPKMHVEKFWNLGLEYGV